MINCIVSLQGELTEHSNEDTYKLAFNKTAANLQQEPTMMEPNKSPQKINIPKRVRFHKPLLWGRPC